MPYGSTYHTVHNVRVHTHGPSVDACTRNAERATTDLPVDYTLLQQAVVAAGETIGRFQCESSDDEWNDPGALQHVLLSVDETLSRGLEGRRAYK